MRTYGDIKMVLMAALTGLSAFAAGSAAAKGGWHYYDPDCPIALGAKSMKFVASQPKLSVERYCDAIPETGSAVIALDVQDRELSDMTWDIRILRDLGKRDGEEDPSADAVVRVPAEKHRNGMVNFDFSLKDAGNYILLVAVANDDGTKTYVGRHHFTAGVWEPAEIYTVFGFGALVLLGGGFAAYRYAAARRRG